MTKLYSKLATVYHEMYQNIFNYKKEFKFYDKILKQYWAKSILEIWCGSWNLAEYFRNCWYKYVWTDLSNDMLDIAKQIAPKATFFQSDMREITHPKKFDAIIISWRSFTYMTTNIDALNALTHINQLLKKNGILIFDNFNAKRIVSLYWKEFEQESTYKWKTYIRKSKKTPNFETWWTENWFATYIIKEKWKKDKIIKDKSIIRSFTKDEIEIFLNLCNFETIKFIDQDFAFTTLAIKS